MRKIFRIFVLCLAVMSAASCSNLPRRNMDPSVLVIPSRYTIVKFAFGLTRMRPITLIAYDVRGDSELIHMWNPSLQEWVKMDMEEYSSGNIATPVPTRVHILGPDSDIPMGMAAASDWAPVVQRIESLNIATALNSLDEYMHFSVSEWKALAKRHNLVIEDANKYRRRYGRYGKPGEEIPVPMPEDEIAEEVVVEPVPPAKEDVVEIPMINPEDK